MTLRRLPVFAVLGVLAAAVCTRADDAPPPAVQDDAHLFDEPAARQADEELRGVGDTYRLTFFLKTVEKPPAEVQKQLKEARDNVTKDKILRDWGKEEAQKDGRKAVYILVCKEAVHGWIWTYGCVVITVPAEARSGQFTDEDAQSLHDRLRWFTRGGDKAKNDAILLSSVDRVRNDLYYNHLPPFPWLGVGGVMAGVFGLWGVLGLARMRLRAADRAAAQQLRKKAGQPDADAPPEPPRLGLFHALLGGMFGSVAGHWIYDSLFVAASHAAPPAEETPIPQSPPAAEAAKEAVQVEDAEPPPPTKAERLDFAARDHPAEEEPTAPGPAPR